jgi:hypothetical protein
VTADNLDGVLGGDVTTQTFTGSVLGDWKDPTFEGGQLQDVVADGVYDATVDVDKQKGRDYTLNLGSVYTAATVTVNGTDVGDALYAPYEVDITKALRNGSNDIQISVTPRKANRYYPAATNKSGQYSTSTPVDAGLVGPISLNASAIGDVSPAATTKPSITGTPSVGSTLKAKPGTWDVEGTTYAYQWLRDGKSISGATSTAYKVVTADAGHTVSVRVTATADGYQPGMATSAGTTIRRLASTSAIKLSATKVRVGTKVTVSVTVTAPGLKPTGRVTITRNGKKVGTVSLAAGKATVKLKAPGKGSYKFEASYAGSTQVAPSHSKKVTLAVTKKK